MTPRFAVRQPLGALPPHGWSVVSQRGCTQSPRGRTRKLCATSTGQNPMHQFQLATPPPGLVSAGNTKPTMKTHPPQRATDLGRPATTKTPCTYSRACRCAAVRAGRRPTSSMRRQNPMHQFTASLSASQGGASNTPCPTGCPAGCPADDCPTGAAHRLAHAAHETMVRLAQNHPSDDFDRFRWTGTLTLC